MIEPANSAAVDSSLSRPKSKASEASASTKVSRQSQSRGKKKSEKEPKKKKLSKKELARLKKEKEEQERLEQERREAEIRDQKEREYEQKKREEQQQRLAEEDAAIKKLREQRKEEGRRITAEQNQAEDWQLFVQCSHDVDARSTSDVNSFLATWDQQEETDLKTLFDRIEQSQTITNNLTVIMQKAEVSQDHAQYERCKDQIARLNQLFRKKIEEITIHHLVFSDQFSGAKNEILVTAASDAINYGMWVNLSKNPRNKEISFPGVKIEFPKTVAMTSIAIRILTMKFKPFSETYLFLDNLIKCEFIQLPTPPKHVGTMTLRQSPHMNSLTRIVYPLKNITAPQPPLNFTFSYQKGSINEDDPALTIVYIDENRNASTEPISNFSIDKENYEIHFSSMRVGSFALAVPRYNQFPFEYWELTSTSETTFEIYLKTSLLELAIEINGQGLCSMESPFAFKDLAPAAAVEFLLEHGINLIAPKQIEGITTKTPDLEEVLAQGLADSGTGFVVRWSKWNAMLPADRAMLIVKERKDFNEVEEDENEANNEDENAPAGAQQENQSDNASQHHSETEKQSETASFKPQQKKKKAFRAILVKANHIVEVPNTEDEEECLLKPLNEEHIHLHLLPMLLQDSSEEVKERVKSCPSFLCDAVLYFLKQLRLFSMSK